MLLPARLNQFITEEPRVPFWFFLKCASPSACQVSWTVSLDPAWIRLRKCADNGVARDRVSPERLSAEDDVCWRAAVLELETNREARLLIRNIPLLKRALDTAHAVHADLRVYQPVGSHKLIQVRSRTRDEAFVILPLFLWPGGRVRLADLHR